MALNHGYFKILLYFTVVIATLYIEIVTYLVYVWAYITIVFKYLTIARLFLLNVIFNFNFLRLIATIYGNCDIISLKVTLFFTLNFIWTVLRFKYKIGLPHFIKLCDISNEPFLHVSLNRHLIYVGNICFSSIRYWQGFHCYNCYWHFNSYFINSSWLSLHSLSCHKLD